MSSQGGRNDCHAVPTFRHREQGVRGTALKLNVWLDACEPASGVKGSTKYEPGIEQKQRISCEAVDFDSSVLAKP